MLQLSIECFYAHPVSTKAMNYPTGGVAVFGPYVSDSRAPEVRNYQLVPYSYRLTCFKDKRIGMLAGSQDQF